MGLAAEDVDTVPVAVDGDALLRRIDLRVIPILFVIYLAAFLDRVNIANAITLGLPVDLHLDAKTNQTNVALTIFFVPYIIFEIPSNFLLRHFKPPVWLSGCVLLFGIVMICQGFAEAGIFPGSCYLIRFWYKREEAQQRFTVYWCSVLTASMFGGLLASAIANMDGIRRLSSWRWIFILEGTATVAVGFAAFFLVSDFPTEAKRLTEHEREWVVTRTGSGEKSDQPINARLMLHFFADVKNILAGLVYFSIVIPIYAFAYFAPTIVKTLGYSTVNTQLHTVPPTAAALALCLLIAFLSDRTGLRSPFIGVGLGLTIAGLAILITVHNIFSAQYTRLCLVAIGAFSAGPIIICWYVMSLDGHVNRSIGTGWMISFGTTEEIVATFAFLAKDAPRYHTGYSILLAFLCLGSLATALYMACVWRQVRRFQATDPPEEIRRRYF
ncbi:MAG: hypothetical protein LQ339_005924 [Xanthoria mediterranea]|nr:MAG: hypothetical protein LQ339_005924 [Xanthoria mediterranea]